VPTIVHFCAQYYVADRRAGAVTVAADIYLRGRIFWWRWRPSRRFSEKFPTMVRMSLRTGCKTLARQRAARLGLAIEGAKAVKNFMIGGGDLAKFYKEYGEAALDRIIGDQLNYPALPHAQSNLAHARLYAMIAEHGEMPEECMETINLLQARGISTEDIASILDLIHS